VSRNLTGDVLAELLAAHEQRLQAERDLAAARGEQYAQVIDIGPCWDDGAPLPHLISNGSRTFVAADFGGSVTVSDRRLGAGVLGVSQLVAPR
jgi:hypothetical protein